MNEITLRPCGDVSKVELLLLLDTAVKDKGYYARRVDDSTVEISREQKVIGMPLRRATTPPEAA